MTETADPEPGAAPGAAARAVQARDAIDPDTLAAVLRTWPVARLAVSRPGRAPWSVPIVFAPCNDALWSPFDGKPKKSGQLARAMHLEREGKATLLLDEYTDDWSALWWIRLEVTATVHRLLDAEPARHPGARALLAKYPQYRTTELFRGPPMLVEMRRIGLAAWAAAGLAESRFASGRA